MSERGYIQLLDANGKEIYAEFTVDSQEDVRVLVTKEVLAADGTTSEVAVDFSVSTTKAYFRGSLKSSATVSVNVELTAVNTGSDGLVTGVVVFRRTDFAAAAVTAAGGVECSVVVVDEVTADALTVSTKKETLWKGRWLAKLREPMNEAVT